MMIKENRITSIAIPMILTLLLLLPFSNAKKQDDHALSNAMIFENHGILLKPKGLITFSSENMISVFRKVKLPTIVGPKNCDQKFVGKYNNKLLTVAQKYVDLFENIATPQTRKKRSIVALGIGLGIADLVLSGIGYGSLRHHINSVEKHFNTFVSTQHQFNDQLLEFDKNVVKIVGQLSSELNEKLAGIQCQILSTTGELLARQFLHEWEDKIKRSLFSPLITGAIKTRLTPEILSPGELSNILTNQSTLQNSYYAKNIYSFYNVGQISLVQSFFDIISGTLTVHQILHFPHVTIDNVFPFFETHQVGVTSKTNHCVMIAIPKHMYLKNGHLFAVDSNNCQVSTGPIATCFAEILKTSEPNDCLKNVENCTVNQTPCKPRYVYDTSGILIGTGNSKTDIQVFAASQNALKKSLKVIRPSEFATKFISWEHVSYVQVESILVQRPEVVTQFMNYNFSDLMLEGWKSKISNFTAPQLDIPTFTSTKASERYSIKNIIIAIAVSAVIVSIITVLTMLLIMYGKNSKVTDLMNKGKLKTKPQISESNQPQSQNTLPNTSTVIID